VLLKRSLIVLTLIAAMLGGNAVAGFSAHLDPLGAVVQQRLGELVVFDRATRKQEKALQKALKLLAKASASNREDLKIASKVARALDKRFPGDVELGALLDTTIGGLRADLDETRDTLEDLTGRFGSPKLADAVTKGVAASDKLVGKSDATAVRTKKSKLLSKALGKLEKARRAVERSFETVEGGLYIRGTANLPRAGFVPVRQTGDTDVLLIGDETVRAEWSDGDTPGLPGNYVLSVRFRDAVGDMAPDNVSVSLFRLAGAQDPVLAWGRETFGVSLETAGVEIRVGVAGVELVLDGLELTPLQSSVNAAEGKVILSGTLPLEL